MTTFSQLVDEMAAETKRPDLRGEIATYLNQTLREVHFEPSKGNVAFYNENRREALVTATSEVGQVWDIPTPQSFQAVEAVRYASLYLGRLEFVDEVSPGPRMASKPFFWYRSGPSIVFGGTQGYGGIGGKIQISWFEYVPSLKYKAVVDRGCTYDVESGFTYKAGIVTPEDQATARAQCTNWLLMRWTDVLREGLRAKIYKRLSDQLRQTTSYSLFMQMRQGLYTSEVSELTGA